VTKSSYYIYNTLAADSFMQYIVHKHWTDSREFITRTVQLWNRCSRLSCYFNRI